LRLNATLQQWRSQDFASESGALVLKQGVKYNYETGCHLYVDRDKIIIYGQITQQKLQLNTGL
jgi:hypothetical protein